MSPDFSPISIEQLPKSNPYISRKRNTFNDKRLSLTYQAYMDRLISSKTVSVRQSSRDGSEASRFYRFFKNEKVSIAELIQMGCELPKGVRLKDRHVLVAGDSTSFTMSHHKNRIQDIEQMGVIQNGNTAGYYAHVNMAVCAKDRTILGLTDILLWNQSKEKRKISNKATPLEKKYSYKWHMGVNHSEELLKEAKQITYLFDREADTFELMHYLSSNVKKDFVIRQCQDRRVLQQGKVKRVSKCLEQAEVLGTFEVEIAALNHPSKILHRRVNRHARSAIFEVKVLENLELLPTEQCKDLSTIKINLIEVEESTPNIVDKEGPICWRLWTTHPINSIEAVRSVIEFYMNRWMIEQLFRVIKRKGFDQESTELETTQAIMKQTVMVLHAGCKVLQLVYARDAETTQPIKDVFSTDEIKVLEQLNENLEGKTQKQKNPNPKNKLSWASWIIARLGGWKGYSSERPPGPLTMKWGIDRFNNYMEAFRMFNSS